MQKKITKQQIKLELADVKPIVIKAEVAERETTKAESVPEQPTVKVQSGLVESGRKNEQVVKEKREAKTSLGKRSRKELKKQFLELEADEGEEEEDSGVKKQVKEAELKQQYYKEDELRPSANRLDKAFIKKLEIRAKKEEQDVKLETKQDPSDLEASEAMEVDEVERDVTLPSNMDSKLWRLKVKPGIERQLVMRLTNKLISRLNEGQPLLVLQVFECENSSGLIYVEAHKLSHVEQLTRGISGIWSRGLKMIPIGEMTDIMKACSLMKDCPVQPRQWVRINKGVFQGDLALVEHVIDFKKVLVRLIPRIPDSWLQNTDDQLKGVAKTLKSLQTQCKGQPHVKIPARMFNPQQVKTECHKELYKPLRKNFFIWKDMMFRNGMLYHTFSINKVAYENVCPMLDEVRRFQACQLREEGGLFDSDLDDWDMLPDKALLRTIRNDTALRVQPGDICRVFEGQFQGCVGKVESLNDGGLATLLTDDKVSVTIKIPALQLEKIFKVGESVRIIQGVHAGEPGIILHLSLPDQRHATMLMEHTKNELTVVTSNLRRKEELDPKHSLTDIFQGNLGASDKSGQTVKEVFSAGDLVLFNGHNSLGLVLQVQPDSLLVLQDNNTTSHVKLSHISKKIAIETRGVNNRRLVRKPPVVTDKYHNVITMRTVVKPVDGPFEHCLGDVRGIYKNTLFLLIRMSPNQHLLKKSNNYYACKTHQVINAGHDQIKDSLKGQEQACDTYGFMAGKMDKRMMDRKATGQTVFIVKGHLKGYKGRIVFADAESATIQVFAKGNQQVTVSRDSISTIADETAAYRMVDQGPMQISFDEAMGQEFVNVPLDEDGNPINNGGGTPVGHDAVCWQDV